MALSNSISKLKKNIAQADANYKKNAKFLNGASKYDANGNAVRWSDAHPTQYYNPGTSYGTPSSSYTPPNYSDYVSAPPLSQAPTAPTLSAAPRAKANTEQFSSKWSDELQAMYDQIANRPKFSYDQNSDPLYQQYAEMYRKNAQLAMDDTVARAASLTGGYGNSYAETAGQAMYNQQMDNLNQRALDLYYAALDTYDRENQNMERKFNLAGQMYNNDYNAWRARVADDQWKQDYDFNAWQADNANAQWKAGYDFDAWQANNENRKWQTQFDYDRYINDRNFGYNQFIDDRNYNYQLGRDAISDRRYDTEWQHQLEREGIEDDRYADELAYSRWRDYIGDRRYDDETEYARQQADLDRALQYYQAGYDPKTKGMSAEARQQYELGLKAQGIDPATGNMSDQAMLQYLASVGNNAGVNAYVDGMKGLSAQQKQQLKTMYHTSNNNGNEYDKSLLTHQIVKEAVDASGGDYSHIMTESQFNNAKKDKNTGFSKKYKTYQDYLEECIERYMKD